MGDISKTIWTAPIRATARPLHISIGDKSVANAATVEIPLYEMDSNVSISSTAQTTNVAANFFDKGGFLLTDPKMVAVFIGDWSASPSQVKSLTQFCKDLMQGTLLDVLKQYGFNQGTVIGTAMIPSKQTTFNEVQLGLLLQDAINKKILPEPVDKQMCYMLFFSDNIGFSDPSLQLSLCEPKNSTAFGFHHDIITAAGNRLIYSFIPSLNDACVTSTCAKSSSCSLSTSETQLQRQTQVASHEFAEMVTNPLGTGWFNIKTGDEIGDVCNGTNTNMTVGDNTWLVQKIYSKTDDQNTSGRSICFADTQSTSALEAAQRLSDTDLLVLACVAGTIMLLAGLFSRAWKS